MLDPVDLARAARALSARRDEPVTLQAVEELRPGRVARCTVRGGGPGESVVVKVPDRADGAHHDLATVHNEHAALALLRALGSTGAATLLAADGQAGVLVLEDLGEGPSLATALLGRDPHAAEAAALAAASALGTLHGQTVGHGGSYRTIRAQLGPFDPTADLFTLRGRDLRRVIERLPAVLAGVGLPGLAGCRGDLDTILRELAHPGDLLALSSGDPCPDNGRLVGTGTRFFDFEAAAFRHALVDAAHFVIPYPNCWCWRRLPADLSTRMVEAHRSALARSSSQAADPDRHRTALTRAVGAWALWTLHRRLPDLATDRHAPGRIVEALANLSRHARGAGELLDLARLGDTLAADLGHRYPAAPAETYPAFGGPPWPHPL